ncbi:MAG: sigma 54-interacting transcriptional regulator, partial [Spirochaetota bacterium]
LQHKVFEKLGSSETMKVDVRVIAASNKDIEKLVEEGKFRNDLYYRLNVLPLFIPPLRQRPEDIIALADFFLKKFNRETKKQILGFSGDALESLFSYQWPGNVRELENSIERAVVICTEEYIKPEHLIINIESDEKIDYYLGRNLKEAVDAFKRNFIKKSLERSNWRQTETAKMLGIQRTYLSRIIKELQISR